MNTPLLNKKMRTYRNAGLTPSVETADATDSLSGEDSAPNSYILNEMKETITSNEEHDKITTMLNDSNEALRRLDIILMNVNYPVSSYKMNSNTLLKADPALEGMIIPHSFSKKKLTVSIENAKMDLLITILSLIVTLFGVKIIKVLTRMRTAHLEKKYNIGKTEFRRIAFAAYSNDRLNWKRYENILKSNTPKYYERIKDSKKAITKDYLKAMYDEIVYPNMSNATRAMITRPNDVETLVKDSTGIAPQIGPFMNDIVVMCFDMSNYLTSSQDSGMRFEDPLIEKHKNMIKEVVDFAQLSKDVLSIRDAVNLPTLETFLPQAEKLFLITGTFDKNRYLALEASSKSTSKKLEGVQSKVMRLSKNSQDMKLDDVQGSVVVLQRAIQTLSNLFTVVDNIVSVNMSLHKTLYSINRAIPVTVHN